MLNAVKSYVPSNWTLSSDNQSDVNRYTEEYRNVKAAVRASTSSTFRIRRMIRVEDLHAFGQFLIREQLLLNLDPSHQLYRVRCYIQVNRDYLNEIIKYNLDPRRCGLGQSLTFQKQLTCFDSNRLIVVVKVLTTEPSANGITPKNSTDYFVEYIIET